MSPRTNKKTSLDAQIISSIGKPISTKELLARLLRIADELSAVDQEHVVQAEYRDLATNLANPKLVQHKNIGIQAYTACAIADIIRLFAPDAPFTTDELSDIFKAFFAQFSHLWDEENPYFAQQAYILKRVVEVRSVVLIGDLPNSQELVSSLFDTMYNLTTKGFPSKLEPLASEMLSEAVSEIDHIPQGVVSLIIKRLTVSADSDLLSRSSNISNPAFTFSLAICEANSDKMARQVAQLFSEMLDESAKLTHERERQAPFRALEKIHDSSVQLWAYVPDLLASVMGLISDELNSDDENIRALATKTIGKMLSSPGRLTSGHSAVTFINYHKETWLNWLKKSSDNSSMVRATWVDQLPEILSLETTSEINLMLTQGLAKCLIDSSEKVRLRSCRAMEVLHVANILTKACDSTILKTLFSLSRERHADIRSSAIGILANLYNKCMSTKSNDEMIDLGSTEPENYKEVVSLIVSGIPNNILQLNYINDKSIIALVDIALFEKLLPFNDSATTRVFRLCHFLKVLDEKSKLAFLAITKRQKQVENVAAKFLDLAEDYATDSSSDYGGKENSSSHAKANDKNTSQLHKILAWLSASLPDGLNSYECFELFFRLRNLRFINLLKNCVSPLLNYKTVKNSAKELLSSLSEAKNIKAPRNFAQMTTSDMVSNFKILIYRSSTILYNKSNITEILKLSQNDNSELQDAANELISLISSNTPSAFKTHVANLSQMLSSEEPEEINVSLLQSLYHILVKFPECFPGDPQFLELLSTLAIRGSPSQAKYAMKILGCSPSKKQLVAKTLDPILPLDSSSEVFGTHLSVLAESFLIDPHAISSHSSNINSIVVEKVLKVNRLTPAEVKLANESDWIDEAQIEDHKILAEKLVSLRLIANKLRFIAASDSTDLATLSAVEKPINLLANIVSNNGEIVKVLVDEVVITTPVSYRRRLKLMAGLMLLKLAKYPRLNPYINIEVTRKLTRLLLDECIQIRKAFLKALQKHLQEQKISEKFLPLLFFMGHEQDAELRKMADSWVLSQHQRAETKNDTLYECTLVRLIHALAHDDKFHKLMNEQTKTAPEREIDAYVYLLGYIAMFLGTIAKEKNIGLLYYLASRVKQYRDKLIDSSLYSTENVAPEVLTVYCVAELVQLMLKELADSKSWTLQTWPGKINLPADLFSPMEDYHQAQEFVSRVYIQDQVQVELREILSHRILNGVKRKSNILTKPQGAKRAKVVANSRKLSTRKKRAKLKNQINAATKPSQPPVTRRSGRLSTRVYYGESEHSETSISSEEELADSASE